MNNTAGGMTTLMYEQVVGGELTLEEAVELLHENAHVRTVHETLCKLTGIAPQDKAALRSLLMEKLLSIDPSVARDTVDKRVQGWLKDTLTSIKKENAVQLCFLFHLSVAEADDLLVRLCGMGFHWRSPEDIVHIYALKAGMTYPDACALMERMRDKGLLDEHGAGENQTHTVMVKSRVDQLANEAQLEDFLRMAAKDLGNYHNTAYMLFENYMSCLERPDAEEEAMSVDAILMTYLHRAYLPRTERGAGDHPSAQKLALSGIQKAIRENWPDKRLLSNMHTRKIDVTRKALILLFLATDGEWTAFASGDDYLTTTEEVFEDVHSRMTDMLIACGFPPLDARVPFDWMILYCMCVNERLLIDGRLQHFLSEMFPSTNLEPELTDVVTSTMTLPHKPER